MDIALNASPDQALAPALRFITCGSVDDGKSTLIGRLLLDSQSVLQDQLAHVTHQATGEVDAAALARLTDGLQAERAQGITIDVAWRYFSSTRRKFIIGDAPGHEQYTRNMVTAASQADCAVVLVDATKLPWASTADVPAQLLPQTRRHTLLTQLLRVPHCVFAINKLDAVADPALAFVRISEALQSFTQAAGIQPAAILPLSALKGWNVVDAHPGWCNYQGPTLLDILEQLPVATAPQQSFALPVQWVESSAGSAQTDHGRRTLWGRVSSGSVQAGDTVQVFPGGQQAVVAQVLDHARRPATASVQRSVGLVLDRELDITRGDWIVAATNDLPAQRQCSATLTWLDNEALVPGRQYWALHGHRWVKARVRRVEHQLDIHTLEQSPADQLGANAIGQVELEFQAPLPLQPYAHNRQLGALILVDTATHATAAAAMVR